ncbi:MAG: lipid A deacylase LpxR family protein [Desulfobacterales bacterium]|nr:lipid A deacylase LpxR family protein [Desulfobacterales bacterium]
MQSSRLVLAAMVSILLLWTARQSPLCAQDFYLDSPRNIGTLRLEIDNDIVWDDDSGFTNGWSIQYHTVCYPGWEESETIRWVKWVGSNFPALGDGDSVIRYSHGFGQNMITPGNLAAEIPQQGDLPYAGTLTYSLNWQRFNRKTARSFQISVGVLGEASLAEPFQKFVHDDLGGGEDPKGWDTQRDTEPIVNIGYQYSWCLADWGGYHDDWAGQLTLAPSASLGNLFTAAELVVAFRTGWNMPEGFSSYAAPPGPRVYPGLPTSQTVGCLPPRRRANLGGPRHGLGLFRHLRRQSRYRRRQGCRSKQGICQLRGRALLPLL